MKTVHHGETYDGRRFTVVGIYDKQEENKSVVKFGVAMCNEVDSFVRKIGKSIAEGRAIKNPTLIKELKVEFSEDKNGYTEISKLGRQVLDTIVEDPYLYQEILSEQAKEIEKRRKEIRLAQIKEHEDKLRQQQNQE